MSILSSIISSAFPSAALGREISKTYLPQISVQELFQVSPVGAAATLGFDAIKTGDAFIDAWKPSTVLGVDTETGSINPLKAIGSSLTTIALLGGVAYIVYQVTKK